MILDDILTNVNTFIGDSSLDRLSLNDRYQAATEATAWLLEELGNEHMTDRTTIEYLPTVTWYKMDNFTPYLLTAGQLRFRDEDAKEDFMRVESRELGHMARNKTAYAIERFNDDSYLGIVVPESAKHPHKDLIGYNKTDNQTHTGVNAVNILKEKDAVRFDMANTGVSATGLETITSPIAIDGYENDGVLIFEVEIPDITGVTSVTLRFGTNFITDYYTGTVTQDVNGNNLVEGVNTIKINWSDLILLGNPDLKNITHWRATVNHNTSKPVVEGFKISDLRITRPVYLNFKYIFYRVGKNSVGDDIIEFTAGTDIPFFADRYPQYRFAVARKAAAVLYRGMQQIELARDEDRQADAALRRYRKNFSNERDTGSSAFKPAGISFRNRRLIRRR